MKRLWGLLLTVALFLQPIVGGEIDYRFAVEAMHNADYDGFMSIEGVFGGDQYYSDKISLEYCKNLWKELEK